jgi:hypothetical protein
MVACLVQQLFRQKVGIELDQGMVDEVLFPMLRQRGDLPRELLLDIKMTQSCNDIGESAIVQISRELLVEGISPFTKTGFVDTFGRSGKNTSRKRRRGFSPRRSWGSIDILNELRNLKHPHIGYHYPCNSEDEEGLRKIGLHNSFIRLEEDKRKVDHHASRIRRQGHRRSEVERQKITLKFVNNYLEDCLNKDWKRLSWGGDPNVNSFKKILSTLY